MGPFTKPVTHAALAAARSLNALQRRSLSAPRAPLTIAKVLDQRENSSDHLLAYNPLVVRVHPAGNQIFRFRPCRHFSHRFGSFAQPYSFCQRSPPGNCFQTF
jgi:hypothetical protein